MSKEERVAIVKQIVGECKVKEGGNDADEADALSRQPPTTRGSKCIHACFAETVGLMKDGKLNGDGIIEMTTKAFGGDEKALNVAKAVAAECSSVSDPDRCEFSAKAYACSRAVINKSGIDPESIM